MNSNDDLHLEFARFIARSTGVGEYEAMIADVYRMNGEQRAEMLIRCLRLLQAQNNLLKLVMKPKD